MAKKFSGKQCKGAMREHRAAKREEALARAETVNHNRTRAHRLGKCDCKGY